MNFVSVAKQQRSHLFKFSTHNLYLSCLIKSPVPCPVTVLMNVISPDKSHLKLYHLPNVLIQFSDSRYKLLLSLIRDKQMLSAVALI